jgi:flagellar hook-length control protein FliK
MNLTPFSGSGITSQLSDSNENSATALIVANPLSTAVNTAGLRRDAQFELSSLLDLSMDDESQPIVDDVMQIVPPLLETDAAAPTIGDKKQNLLAHLLHSAETVSLAPMIARNEVSIPAEQSITATLPLSTPVLEKSAEIALPMTAAVKRHQDAPMPIQPQFFGQTLLNNKSTQTDSSLPDVNNLLSTAAKGLAEYSDGAKTTLNVANASSSVTNNGGNESQFNWAPIKLRGTQEQMSQQLHAVLRERLQIQSDNRVQQATIRLDPPHLGKIDISLHIDAGKLNVQIHAAQNDVFRSLQQVSNELRQHLTDQNFMQVNVQVSSDSSHQQQEHKKENFSEENILAAQEIESLSSANLRDDSILTTV